VGHCRQKKASETAARTIHSGMIVIMNRDAGKTGNGKGSEETRIMESFMALGEKPRIVQPQGDETISSLARDAALGSEKTIVAAGGDGTISGVAGELAGTEKVLGVLPIGTLNHFAKDLGIPLDLAAAVGTVVHGRIKKVDAGEVNGRIFINNSSLGIYPHIVSRREAQQHHLARGKWMAFLWATIQAFRRFPFLDLRIAFEGQEIARRTAFLFVGNNKYETAGFNLGSRPCVNGGNLGLYLTHGTGRFGLFRLALHALFGRVDQAQDFDVFSVAEARIETRKRRLLLARDGEVEWMKSPLKYRIRPNALRVLVPNDTV
jgi:diacylglycerol kinase family enzyme